MKKPNTLVNIAFKFVAAKIHENLFMPQAQNQILEWI